LLEELRRIPLVWVIVCAFGAVFGSFINVVIYRLPRGLSLAHPPSACPKCDQRIKPYDNIPIISYLILRGRCRNCATQFTIRYPAVEFLGAVLTLGSFLFAPTPLEVPIWTVLTLTLLAVTFIDFDWQIIPDLITIPGVAIGLILAILGPFPLLSSIIGAVAGGGGLLLVAIAYRLVTGRDGLGMGDVKLMAMIGAFTGWQGVLGTLFIGSMVGTLICVSIILKGKGTRLTAFPFGTFLAPAAWVILFFGDILWTAYLSLFP